MYPKMSKGKIYEIQKICQVCRFVSSKGTKETGIISAFVCSQTGPVIHWNREGKLDMVYYS